MAISCASGSSARGAAAVFGVLILASCANSDDWARFRGPGGSGVFETSNLPTEFGLDTGVRWKVTLPPGHSSPVMAGDRLFLTGFEEETLITLCLNAEDGEILWRRTLARPRKQEHHKYNNPASPTPVTDGHSVFAFFPDFGLIAYGVDGDELWRRALGPFRNLHGVASSPVLAGEVLVQVCDQDTGSFLVLCDKRSGAIVRRVERFSSSFSTPVVYQRGESCEIVVPGSGELAGYGCRSGDRLWWIPGMPFIPKSSPIVTQLGSDGLVIFHALSADNLEKRMPPWPQYLAQWDKDRDGLLTPTDLPGAVLLDFDGDGVATEAEYDTMKEGARAPHTLLAVRPGQRGDVSAKVLWRNSRGIPQVATPIVYKGTLYLLKEGGIFSSLDPRTGEVHKRGRLTGAVATYYSSPVASGGRLYLASLDGHIVVVKAGPEWEIESVSDLGEPIFATPAIAEGRLYVRTPSALYCFAKDDR
jgi:outer membrane protein assembly factor BamB